MSNRSRPQGMSVLSLFCLAVGTIIGVGWITLLGQWLGQAGSAGAALALIAGGLIVLPVVFCYAEGLSLAPHAGGEIAFIQLAGGSLAGFVAGWTLLLVFLGVVAFEAISVAWISSVLFPPILGPVLYEVLGAEVRLGGVVIGVGGTFAIAVLHAQGNRSIERLQNLATLAKLAAALVFVGAGLAFGEAAHLAPLFPAGGPSEAVSGIASVLAVTPLFYAGFNAMLQAVNERDPRISLRSVGWILVASIVVAMVFYAGVIVSAAMSAPRNILLVSDLPAAAAFEHAFGTPWLSRLVLIAGLLGLISAWNATFFAATRVLAVLAEARVVSGWFSRRSGSGALLNAILFCSLITAGGAVLGRNAIGPIVSTSALALVVMFLLASWAVLRLRRTAPEVVRGFPMPGGAAMGWLALLLSAALLVITAVQAARAASGAAPEFLILGVWAILGLAAAASRPRRTAAPEGGQR